MSTHQHARTGSRGFRIVAVITGAATVAGVTMLLSPSPVRPLRPRARSTASAHPAR